MPTFPTPAPVAVKVEIICGDIAINASDRADSVVTVAPRDEHKPADVKAAETAQVELTNGELIVKTAKNWGRLTGPAKKDGLVVVTIDVPTGSSLAATTGMGFIHGEGELADAAVRSGMGDIRLDRVRAFSGKTGFGDVVVDGIAKDAAIKTGTGAIRLGLVEGSVSVKNANGGIEIAQCQRIANLRTSAGNIAVGKALSSVNAGSAAGDISIAEVSAGAVTVKTGLGAISIGIREGAAAWLEVNSKYGSVRNGLTPSAGPVESDSKVEVRAQTGAGDITITRAA